MTNPHFDNTLFQKRFLPIFSLKLLKGRALLFTIKFELSQEDFCYVFYHFIENAST